ncbi:MAG: beta-N-acetylglucosaminidase domain-containing protein [Chloroflexota bacterium]
MSASPGAALTGSPFAIRGVIEGFYGRPWTHEQRLALIPFLADRGMNAFVYGPKDDPLLRRDWRRPYDGEWLARLSELVGRCRAHGMRFTWCVSPGLSMRYWMPPTSMPSRPSSRAWRRWGSIPSACCSMTSRASSSTRTTGRHSPTSPRRTRTWSGRGAPSPDRPHLVVCPTVYRGTGTEDYLVRLAGGIDPRIDLFWTGRAVCSPVLDLADAAAFTRATLPAAVLGQLPGQRRGHDLRAAHRPVPWPRPAAVALGDGHRGQRHGAVRGVRIPFATIADYLRDPEGYDPEASWQRAIRDVVGEADAEAFALFADNVRSSPICDDDAPAVGRALERLGVALDQGEAATREAAQGLAMLADRLLAAATRLQGDGVTNRALMDECRPWLAVFERGARALARLAGLAAEGRLGTDGTAELRPYLIRLRRARARVFGDVVEMALSDLTGTMFRPGEVPVLEGGAP